MPWMELKPCWTWGRLLTIARSVAIAAVGVVRCLLSDDVCNGSAMPPRLLLVIVVFVLPLVFAIKIAIAIAKRLATTPMSLAPPI